MWPLKNSLKHLGNSGRGLHEEHLCAIIFNLGQQLRQMSFKEFFYHTGNFGKGLQKEYLCEITLDLGQHFRKRGCLKISFYFLALATI